jgi:hypothetical protein
LVITQDGAQPPVVEHRCDIAYYIYNHKTTSGTSTFHGHTAVTTLPASSTLLMQMHQHMCTQGIIYMMTLFVSTTIGTVLLLHVDSDSNGSLLDQSVDDSVDPLLLDNDEQRTSPADTGT